MHAGSAFGDRYSRYNNLYKVLKLAGINRWCHADTAPYFDLFVPEELRHQETTAWKSGKDYNSSVSSEEEDRGIWRGDKRAERIVEFLDNLKPGERFFFCEHMSDTHFPWERTPADRGAQLGFSQGLDIFEADAILPRGGKHDKYSCYLQTITRMDAQIGTILNKLKEKKLYDNTLVVIVSDHGCQWFEHEHMYYVSHLYDQSLRVPMIIKVPGLPGGQVSHEPVLQIDVLPTLAELAGVRHANPTSDYPMTCQSLVPLLTGSRDVDTARYHNRDMLLCTHYDMLGVVSNFEHKIIFDRPTGTCLVFDLKNDPGETVNLADTRPDLRAMLLEKLRFLSKRHASFLGQIEASSAHN
jgi:membrane-anchored protein YejM (alkaline phosphatase superfamily)